MNRSNKTFQIYRIVPQGGKGISLANQFYF